MSAVRRYTFAWAIAVALLAFALSHGSLRGFDCWMQPDGPDCACFDNTGAWNPASAIIQDTALPTVGTRESCGAVIDNGGKPYYQMVLGCTSLECAGAVDYMYTFGGVYPAREEWCTETVAFWHRQTAIPYPGGYRNAWHHNWQIHGQGGMKEWYETEQALAGGRGTWLAGENVTYDPFALGLTVPVPGAYVAIQNYDSTTNTWVSDTDTTSSLKHSLMIDEMWVYRRKNGRVVRVEVTLLEGNSGEQVKNVGRWDDILSLTPQGTKSIGSSRKIKGFGIDRSPTVGWVYDRSRLHFVEVPTFVAMATVTPVTPDDGEDQQHLAFMARLLAYARLANAQGGPFVTSQAAPNLTRVPDGAGVEWVFPKSTQTEVDILIDLLDVHPMPISGILMTWAPGFVPPTTRVSFSRDGDSYTDAVVLSLANLALPEGAPAIIPASFTQSGDGVPVRYVKVTFPKGAFWQDATLREISFQYRTGPSDDAPERTETRIVDVDIDPNTCPNRWNVSANRPLAVAVLGRPDFDVRRIEAASLELEGIGPVSWKYADVGSPMPSDIGATQCKCSAPSADGIVDLVLRFEGASVTRALGRVVDRDVRTLALKGHLGKYPVDHVEGRDCLVVKMPKPGALQ